MPGGRRRVDVVLAPEFVAHVEGLSMAELRARRHEAEQEEADLSYLRRLLHGRIAIVSAELSRRVPAAGEAADTGALVDDLSAILGDEQRSTRGLGRHFTVEPSRVDEHRRGVGAVIADTTRTDVASRTDAELHDALDRLAAHESEVSSVRRDVQAVVDLLSKELTDRYTDGRASVDDLLAPEPGA
jgi:hypothetical protein